MTTMRCACYARYSSDLQRETSIDDQIAGAREYANRHGWTVLDDHIYSDAGISGASLDGRPGIHALLKAASTSPPPFGLLLVDDTSRLARDTADAIRIVQQLTFAGVRIIFISQGLDTASEQAETLVAVHGVVDQLYIRELKHKIKRGLRGQLERGFHTGALTFGYRSVPVYDPSGRRDADGPVALGKRREVVLEQAEVVRQIYQWYLDGISYPRIADRLNTTDVPTPRGTRWTKNLIQRILTNERYCGKQIWGQTTQERRPGTNRRVVRQRPRDQWNVVDRPELRIVDDDLWHRVQDRRNAIGRSLKIIPKGLARGRSTSYSKHLLVGLSRCQTCGKGFTIVSSGHGSPRYGCPNSWHNGLDACDNRLTIRAKVADPVVLQRLQEALLEPTMLKRMTKAVTTDVRKALSTAPSDRKKLEKRRNDVDRKLANLVAAIEHGIALPKVHEQVAKRQAELRQIDEELETLERPADVNISVIPTWVEQQVRDLSGLLAESPQRAKDEFQRLNMRFSVSPIRDEGKPFLRVEGTGDLDTLCGVRNLPSTARSKPPRPPAYPLSIRDHSLPRVARGSAGLPGPDRARDGALGEQSDWSSICRLADPDRGRHGGPDEAAQPSTQWRAGCCGKKRTYASYGHFLRGLRGRVSAATAISAFLPSRVPTIGSTTARGRSAPQTPLTRAPGRSRETGMTDR